MDFSKLEDHTFSPHSHYYFNSQVAPVDGSRKGPHQIMYNVKDVGKNAHKV